MNDTEMILHELTKINGRLDTIEEKIDILQENQEEIRSCTNLLLDWSYRVSEATKLPLPEILPKE